MPTVGLSHGGTVNASNDNYTNYVTPGTGTNWSFSVDFSNAGGSEATTIRIGVDSQTDGVYHYLDIPWSPAGPHTNTVVVVNQSTATTNPGVVGAGWGNIRGRVTLYGQNAGQNLNSATLTYDTVSVGGGTAKSRVIVIT